MKIVKVLSARYDQIWYAGFIGEMFAVIDDPQDPNQFIVAEPEDNGSARTLYRKDCEILGADSKSETISNARINQALTDK